MFLHKLEGGCQVPIGGYATINEQSELTLTALVGAKDGSVLLKETVTNQNPQQAGEEVARLLIARGADKLVQQSKEQE
ncbi:hypothetical protein GCM10020331_034760 [Ectobacillus funiculus]